MLQFSSASFDAFIEQLFPPLCAGSAVVLRGQGLWDSEMFYRELHEKQISIADLPTAYWFMLTQDFKKEGARGYASLRQVQATGEAMPPEGVRNWREAGLAGVKLLNTYGPTEATVTATAFDCADYVSGEQDLPLQMPIGRPLEGRELRVLDADLNPVGMAVSGDLYIGGALLARGYHDRAALTSERFVADPFSHNGGRLYRTGDRVRWNEKGYLEYLGRADQQVKVRGFRVELGEIEAHLLTMPHVREAVVVARDGAGGVQLTGYVVASEPTVQSAQLRERLLDSVPDYMVPANIVLLDSLPLTPVGKLDRKALPITQMASSEYEAPQGPIEEARRHLVRRALRRTRGAARQLLRTGRSLAETAGGHETRTRARRSGRHSVRAERPRAHAEPHHPRSMSRG